MAFRKYIYISRSLLIWQ